MCPVEHERRKLVPLQWSVQGMQRAVERVRERGWDDPVGAFAAVGETLWWIGVVGEALRERHPGAYEAALSREPEIGQLLDGLRFARNRFTHGVDVVEYLAPTPLDPGNFTAKWTWRPLDERQNGRNHGHAEYQLAVAGEDVAATILRASVFVAQVASGVVRA